MDRARLSLLTASDSLNRAGIYYLQDKATGLRRQLAQPAG